MKWLFVLLLSSCVTPSGGEWTQAGKSKEDKIKDISECRARAGQACNMMSYSFCNMNDEFDTCMFGKGWDH